MYKYLGLLPLKKIRQTATSASSGTSDANTTPLHLHHTFIMQYFIPLLSLFASALAAPSPVAGAGAESVNGNVEARANVSLRPVACERLSTQQVLEGG